MNPNDAFRDAAYHDLIAAQADGELSAAHVERLQSWMAAHPAAAVELETQRRLGWRHSRLWRASAAESPTEQVWTNLLNRIQAALAEPKPTPAPAANSSSRRFAVVLVAIAACLLLAVFIMPPFRPSTDGPNAAAELMVIAGIGDVQILRILDADAALLVVGKPPVRDVIVLAAVEDIEGLRVVKDTDGMMPKIAMQPGPNSPMIVAPMAGK